MKGKRETLATVQGVLAILFWSGTVGLVRSLTTRLGTLTAGSSVYLAAGVLACAWTFLSPKRRAAFRRLPRAYLLGCGALFIIYTACLYLALGLAESDKHSLEVGLVNYLWPGAVMALSVPLLGRKARWFLVPGVLLAFAGTFLAPLGRGDFSWAGFGGRLAGGWLPYLLALIAAVSWGFYSNLSRRWAGASEGNGVPVFILATGLVLLAMRPFFAAEQPEWGATAFIELALLAVFPAFLGYAFWDAAMRRGNMTLVAALSYFTPVLATVVASLYLRKELPGAALWAGCALVTAGALVSRLAMVEERAARD